MFESFIATHHRERRRRTRSPAYTCRKSTRLDSNVDSERRRRRWRFASDSSTKNRRRAYSPVHLHGRQPIILPGPISGVFRSRPAAFAKNSGVIPHGLSTPTIVHSHHRLDGIGNVIRRPRNRIGGSWWWRHSLGCRGGPRCFSFGVLRLGRFPVGGAVLALSVAAMASRSLSVRIRHRGDVCLVRIGLQIVAVQIQRLLRIVRQAIHLPRRVVQQWGRGLALLAS